MEEKELEMPALITWALKDFPLTITFTKSSDRKGLIIEKTLPEMPSL